MGVKIGDKVGRLTIIEKAERPYYYLCECECGNKKEVRSDHLLNEKIRSCGCLHRENSSRIGKAMAYRVAGKNRIDITGKRFGSLTAVKVTKAGDKYHSETWLCKCDCGAEQEVCKSNLLSGHTTSCGCGMSNMEKVVAEILSEHGFSFTKNKTFPSCKSSRGTYAKFDFYVENSYVIECDGEQHEKSTGSRFTEERVASIKKWDAYKNKWCAENGMTIIRIPYWKMDNLNINDLVPETTQYGVCEYCGSAEE